jgi:hypothetical protein
MDPSIEVPQEGAVMRRYFYLLVTVAFTMMGCAANVDEPVDQLPGPGAQREPPAQQFGGDLRIGLLDPVMQAILNQNNQGPGPLPGKQLAVDYSPPDPAK